MKVMIGVPTAEFARRADFYDYFLALDKPDGTVVMFAHGQSPAQNRNSIIRAALENNCTHILFLDDDLAFPANSLHKLLAHDEDVVTGLYLLRNYPHYPVAFAKAFPDGKCEFMLLTPDRVGLVPVVNCGLGFVLIKIEVFKKLKEPWITLGEIDRDNWCDDVVFFNKVRKAGFKLYCDTDTRAGHQLSVTLWPNPTADGWQTQYVTNTGQSLQFPQLVNPMRPEETVNK